MDVLGLFLLSVVMFIPLYAQTATNNDSYLNEICLMRTSRVLCYKLYQSRDPITWSDASTACWSRDGSHLATLPEPGSPQDLSERFPFRKAQEAWLGGKRIGSSVWRWLDETTLKDGAGITGVSRSALSDDVINNCAHIEHVMVSSNDTLVLSSDSCNKRQAAREKAPNGYICQYSEVTRELCQRKATKSDTGPDFLFHHENNKCLVFHKRRGGLTWANARNDCLKEGGDLAMIDRSAATWLLTEQSAMHVQSWIGLHRREWYWLATGENAYPEPVRHSSWDRGHPAAADDCMTMRLSSPGAWRSRPCEENKAIRHYICETTTLTKQAEPTDADSDNEYLTLHINDVITIGCVAGGLVVIVLVISVVVVVCKRRSESSGEEKDTRGTEQEKHSADVEKSVISDITIDHSDLTEPVKPLGEISSPTSVSTLPTRFSFDEHALRISDYDDIDDVSRAAKPAAQSQSPKRKQSRHLSIGYLLSRKSMWSRTPLPGLPSIKRGQLSKKKKVLKEGSDVSSSIKANRPVTEPASPWSNDPSSVYEKIDGITPNIPDVIPQQRNTNAADQTAMNGSSNTINETETHGSSSSPSADRQRGQIRDLALGHKMAPSGEIYALPDKDLKKDSPDSASASTTAPHESTRVSKAPNGDIYSLPGIRVKSAISQFEGDLSAAPTQSRPQSTSSGSIRQGEPPALSGALERLSVSSDVVMIENDEYHV